MTERQLTGYRTQRVDCPRWLLRFGKDPEHVKGYAFEAVRARASRMGMFYPWVWDSESGYVAVPTHDHADDYMEELAYRNTSNADKSNHQKTIQMLFKWREHGINE